MNGGIILCCDSTRYTFSAPHDGVYNRKDDNVMMNGNHYWESREDVGPKESM